MDENIRGRKNEKILLFNTKLKQINEFKCQGLVIKIT